MTSSDSGYKNPPQHSRFKPGQSGNPKGRPKGAKNFKTELLEELQAPIEITENGRKKKITRQRALIKHLYLKAMSGDPRAANVLFTALKLYQGGEADGYEPTASDMKLIEELGFKLRRPE